MCYTATYDTIEKRYYNIGEVVNMLSIPAWTIRFWVMAFDLEVKKSGWTRKFSRTNIEQLHRIKYLLHGEGFTIEGAKRKFKQ